MTRILLVVSFALLVLMPGPVVSSAQMCSEPVVEEKVLTRRSNMTLWLPEGNMTTWTTWGGVWVGEDEYTWEYATLDNFSLDVLSSVRLSMHAYAHVTFDGGGLNYSYSQVLARTVEEGLTEFNETDLDMDDWSSDGTRSENFYQSNNGTHVRRRWSFVHYVLAPLRALLFYNLDNETGRIDLSYKYKIRLHGIGPPVPDRVEIEEVILETFYPITTNATDLSGLTDALDGRDTVLILFFVLVTCLISGSVFCLLETKYSLFSRRWSA